MVIMKSHQAMGSFLGRGTHVWLEIHPAEGVKVTFSGAKVNKLLGVAENLKRDYHKTATRGEIIIQAPHGMDCNQWAQAVIAAGREVKHSMHKKLKYSGLFPSFSGYGNCCTIVALIIQQAGGEIPPFQPSGFAPGLSTLQTS